MLKNYNKSIDNIYIVLRLCAEEDYTAVTFYPDLAKFKMDSLDRDCVALFTRRAYDIAASSRGVKVILNGKRLPVGVERVLFGVFQCFEICLFEMY